MEFNLTSVVVILIFLVSAAATSVLIPYLKTKTTAEQRDDIYFWVKLAVEAAEQIFKGSGMGAQKKEFVLQFLAEHGITLDEKQIDVAIESAVLQMKNAFFE